MALPLEEWQRLPKGFRIWTEADLLWLARKATAFCQTAKELQAEVIATPCLGFAATFERAIRTTGEKTYAFEDRKRRKLMLSPDSSPHVVRWFLANYSPTSRKRVVFISPVFRYRHIKDRFWIQFGLASFNEGHAAIETLAAAYLKTLSENLGLPTWLQVGDLSLHWSILTDAGVPTVQIESLLHKLRPVSAEKQYAMLSNELIPEHAKHDLRALLRLKIGPGSDPTQLLRSVSFRNQSIPSRIVELHESASRITAANAVRHELVFTDFHASELQRGIVVKFKKPDEGHFADGGDYTYYARKVSAEIQSCCSFGGGLLGSEAFL